MNQALQTVSSEEAARRYGSKEPFQVDDILYSTWGYDQTNVDFYKVLAVKGSFVTVRELQQVKNYTGSMVGTALPVDAFAETGSPIRRKMNFSGSRPIIKVAKWGRYTWRWTGQPVSFSEYA